MKAIFEDKVRFLLLSAKERGTKQGVLVCEKTLTELASGKDEESQIQLLSVFNKAYIGIEAHGHITSEEFIAINTLRELERSANT